MWSLTLAITPDDVGHLARSKCTPTAPTAPFNVPFPAMFAVAELLKHGADALRPVDGADRRRVGVDAVGRDQRGGPVIVERLHCLQESPHNLTGRGGHAARPSPSSSTFMSPRARPVWT